MFILFIVTSFWAYGEVTIACEFAARAAASGYKPYFLIPPSHEKVMKKYGFSYLTLIPRNGKVNKLLMIDIEQRLQPSLVILADFLNYNFCETHYGLTKEDLNIFSGKLGTFDDFDWVITGSQMDTYGFKAQKFGEIDIRSFGFSLCPCPVVNPNGGERVETFRYNLTTDILPYERKNTYKWKERLGFPTNRKLILFTNATWQETYRKYPEVVAFVKANNEVFYYLMKELSINNTVVCVGPKGFFSERSDENIIYCDQLAPEIFDKHLLAADLFISRNFVATTLARAVLSGIPSVNFENSLYFSEKKRLDPEKLPFELTPLTQRLLMELDRCYPYRMFPVGWYKFLAPIVRDNPYMKTFIRLEQFNVKAALNRIEEVLECENVKNQLQENLTEYKELLSKLPEVPDIIDRLVKGRR